MKIQNAILSPDFQINWVALRNHMVPMIPEEKKLYLETIVRNLSRYTDDRAGAAVDQLRELQNEIKP